MLKQVENHILLVDKPVGITSFDVIRKLRRKLGIKKMGHAGTLDPLASGLMIIGIGKGTKKLSNYLLLPKTYQAEILLGKSTDTADISGKVIEEKEVNNLDPELVKKEVEGMVGKINLAVPIYSAVKKKGRPLYSYARRGEAVEVPVKKMEVREVCFLGLEKKEGQTSVLVEFVVGSGTYIRSLAEELGRRLGYPATLKNLRRLSIGHFQIGDAVTLD